MTTDKHIEEHLENHGVRPTAVRLLVWKTISPLHHTFTLVDLESLMPDTERSSIFRALRLFAEHHLLHEIDDGSGAQKYCVCRCTDGHHLTHIHFTCRKCGDTFCLDQMKIPIVSLPQGFVMDDAEYVVKGLCPKCS